MKKSVLVCAMVFAGMLANAAWSAPAILFRVPCKGKTDLTGYDALDQASPATALAGGAPVVEAEKGAGFTQLKALHTGKTDQGVSYGAGDRVSPTAGTISFWVIGDNWDKSDGGHDVFWRVEGDELVFPMTKWNYRMIVIEKAAGGEAPSVLRDNGR